MKKAIMFVLLAVCSAAMAKDVVLPVEVKSNVYKVDDKGQPTEGSGTCLAYPKTDNARFAAMLQKVTGGDKSAHVVFFDTSSNCSVQMWAKIYAQKLGYTNADHRESKMHFCETASLCNAKRLAKTASGFVQKYILSMKTPDKEHSASAFFPPTEMKMIDSDMQNPVVTYDW